MFARARNFLVITVMLLTFALLSIPVMGAPATKLEVTMESSPGGPVPYPGYPRWVSNNTISHSRGSSTAITVNLTIPDLAPYPLVLTGDWESDWIANANWKKDPVQVVIMSKLTLTFGDGTFEGVNQRRIAGSPMLPTSIIEDHIVLRGTGAFQGQTLKLSYEGTPPVIAEGYLIMCARA